MLTCRSLVGLCLLWSSAALAQSAPPVESGAAPAATQEAAVDGRRAEASSHFRRGVDLFQEGAYRPALVEFQRAHDISPDHRLLYNIGQTKLQLQDYLGATQSYEAYLVEGGSDVPPDRHAQVESVLASLRERVGRIGFTINRDGADVFLDDVQVGTSPIPAVVLANVGRHRVVARTPDGAQATSIVEVAGGDVTEVQLTLTKPEVASKLPAAARGARAPARTAQRWPATRKAAVVMWSLGGATLLGGAVVGALTKSENDELRDVLRRPGANEDEIDTQRGAVRTLALGTDLLLGLGAASLVTGTILWLLDSGDEKKPEPRRAHHKNLRLQVGVTSVGLSGQF